MSLDLEHFQISKQPKGKVEFCQLGSQSRKPRYLNTVKNGGGMNELAAFTFLQTCHIS